MLIVLCLFTGCSKLRVKSTTPIRDKKYTCVAMCPPNHVADRDDWCRTMEEAETTRWLKSEGLYVHAQTFFDNKITMDVVDMLTREEMKDLGVTIGHMKKLEKALDKERLKAFENLKAFEDSIGMSFGGLLAGPDGDGDGDGDGGDGKDAGGNEGSSSQAGDGGEEEDEVEEEVEEEVEKEVCQFKDYNEFDDFFDTSAEVMAFRAVMCMDEDTESEDQFEDSPYDDCLEMARRDCSPLKPAYKNVQRLFHPDVVWKTFPACKMQHGKKTMMEWATASIVKSDDGKNPLTTEYTIVRKLCKEYQRELKAREAKSARSKEEL